MNAEWFCEPGGTLFEPVSGRFKENLLAERYNSTLEIQFNFNLKKELWNSYQC
jgi:hypothetical protein